MIKLDCIYLANHIRKTFLDLYINEHLKLYTDFVYEVDNPRHD